MYLRGAYKYHKHTDKKKTKITPELDVVQKYKYNKGIEPPSSEM